MRVRATDRADGDNRLSQYPPAPAVAGDHPGHLADCEPAVGEREDEEQQVLGIGFWGDQPVLLGGFDIVDLLSVVGGAVVLVPDRFLAVGESLPVQQAYEMGVGGAVVEPAAGVFADVLFAQPGEGDGSGDLRQFLRDDGGEQAALVTEVVVEPRLVDAGSRSDPLHDGAVEAVLCELHDRVPDAISHPQPDNVEPAS